MRLAAHTCAVCGQRIGAEEGHWHSLQPDADGRYRCRACRELGALLTTTVRPSTDTDGDGE
jgi:predicted RNA-binding Zn-ribbon protein involved in translation (DUF1610 family)